MKRYIRSASSNTARKQSRTAIDISEARNSKDPDRLRELSYHNAQSVRKAVEKNPYTPDDALINMLKDDTYVDYFNLIFNIKDPRKLYDAFPNDRVSSSRALPNVFEVLARNSNTPQDILINVVNSSEPDIDTGGLGIWMALASNPNSPDEVLRTVYDANSSSIDWLLSCNTNIPGDVAEGLVQRYQDSSEESPSHVDNMIVDNCNAILERETPPWPNKLHSGQTNRRNKR